MFSCLLGVSSDGSRVNLQASLYRDIRSSITRFSGVRLEAELHRHANPDKSQAARQRSQPEEAHPRDQSLCHVACKDWIASDEIQLESKQGAPAWLRT